MIATKREDSLAYMTYYEDNEAFNKRKSTGVSWASSSGRTWNPTTRQHDYDFDVEGVVIDNSPVEGVYIGSSVSRWSTSNKLFRVKDPRGFTVEVPTDNIATLLHLTTVTNGVVKEPCVWGREGNNHILLPVNSEPYLDTLEKMDTLANKLIKVKDLQAGDMIELFDDSNTWEYVYLGRAKITWKVIPYEVKRWHRRESESQKTYYPEEIIEDTKWENVFAYRYKDTQKEWSYESKANPKIVKVIGQIEDLESIRSKLKLYSPSRITSRIYSYTDCSIEGVKWK